MVPHKPQLHLRRATSGGQTPLRMPVGSQWVQLVVVPLQQLVGILENRH